MDPNFPKEFVKNNGERKDPVPMTGLSNIRQKLLQIPLSYLLIQKQINYTFVT